MSEVFDYGAMQEVATELIEFFGREIQLRRKQTAPTDAAKPWEGSSQNVSSVETTQGAFIDFTVEARGGSDSIKQTDKQLLFGVQTGDIDTDWEVVDVTKGGQIWKIVSLIEKIEPGPLVVLYTVQVRI